MDWFLYDNGFRRERFKQISALDKNSQDYAVFKNDNWTAPEKHKPTSTLPNVSKVLNDIIYIIYIYIYIWKKMGKKMEKWVKPRNTLL